MKSWILTLLFTLLLVSGQAQFLKSNGADVPLSFFKGSVSYESNSVTYGRQDSVIMPYLTPSLGYYHKSGLYLDASLSWLANAKGRIDLATLEGGYDFSKGDKFSGEIYADKYFYNKNSTAVKSQMKGEIAANASYETSLVSFMAGLDLAFSKKTDFVVTYGISHPFYLGETDHQWTLEPCLVSNAGTQYFVESGKEKKAGSAAALKVKGAGTFQVLDYEISLNIAFDGKQWGFSLIPTYALPLNPISVAKANSNTYIPEKLSRVFFVEAEAYVKF